LHEVAPVYDLPRRRSPLRAALVSLRPRQWTKNLLLFAGIIFAAKLGDLSRWGEAFAAFAAYCAASSASYLVNDVRDAPHDRLHPTKRWGSPRSSSSARSSHCRPRTRSRSNTSCCWT
jgi:4-hydroxybenzoate polyprenyltransferase